jgi:hypothetical protein
VPSRARTETVELDPGHIESMAVVIDEVVDRDERTVGAVPPSYFSAITPFDDPILNQLDEQAEFPYATTAEDHVAVVRPGRPGERLTAALAFDGLKIRPRSTGGRIAFATFSRTFAEADGTEVAQVRWVCALMDEPAAAGSQSADQLVPAHHSRPFTAELAQQWAAWTHDFEPIHLDPATAEAAGLPGPVAHASLVTAVADRLAARLLGPEAAYGFELRHRGGVFFGDSVGAQTSDEGLLLLSERGPVARFAVSHTSPNRSIREGAQA